MIELKNLTKTYRTGKVEFNALRGIDLKIEAGEFVAIMGPSGSGKSTLLHILGFLDRADGGQYLFDGKDISKYDDNELAVLRNQTLGFVFQQFHLLPRLTALENVELPLIYGGKRHLAERAKENITAVGLAERVDHYPNELSGGEQQRVAIARSLVNNPLVIFADEPTGNLDTRSEEEIMKVLEGLNRQGKTIIMITHELEVGQRAKRIIKMRDGLIVGDEVQVPSTPVTAACPTGERKGENGECETYSGEGSAEIKDHFRQAWQSIFSHKLRTLLSMLGIFIGVAAVIAMLALGQGAEDSIKKRLAGLGSNLLMVMPGSAQSHGVSLQAGSVTRLTMQDAEAIGQLALIEMVSPNANGRGQIVYGNKNWNTQVQGTGENYPQMRNGVPTKGRFFSKGELLGRQKVAVIGPTIVKNLFTTDENPLDAIIKINSVSFRVIGVLPERGSSGWHDNDDVIVVPVTTSMYRLFGKEYVDSIDAQAKDAETSSQAMEAIKALIIKRHRLTTKDEDTFNVRNMADIQEAMTSMVKTLAWLLGSIATISLIVGGIGIMNIMLVSVTERTKEIGLRKAIGARRIDIMMQFLIESIVLTFIGGTAGIIFGCAVSYLMSYLAGWTTTITTSSIVLATTFSIAIGMGFGIWPARQASRLNPVEALRYE